jgi:RNA polymerase sigma-70 factor, ECF subfamily
MEIAMYLPANSDQDEAKLIQAADQGDLEAFNQLVLKYENLAYQHASDLLGDPALAEDVTQEIFIKTFQNIPTFRGGSFRSWLLRIPTNTAYGLLRKDKRQRSLPLYLEDDPGDEIESTGWLVDRGKSPSERIEQKDLAVLLLEALNHHPEGYRNVIILVDVYDMDDLEAAEVLNIPQGTVKSRIAWARLQVKEKIEDHLRLPTRVDSAKLASTEAAYLKSYH